MFYIVFFFFSLQIFLGVIKSKFNKFNIMKKLKNIKNTKWILAQIALFAINYIQSELTKQSLIRSSNKRLAEVPPFPLL